MLTIPELMRASHVKRWQIVLTSRPQSLAEHSFNVAMLAQSIAMRCEDAFLSSEQMFELVNWALLHDIIEIRTGDLATPFKDKLRKIGGDDILDRAESDFDLGYSTLKQKYKGTEIEAIVKCADMVDAIYFLGESGLSQQSVRVEWQLRKELQDMLNRYTVAFPALDLNTHVNDICSELNYEVY